MNEKKAKNKITLKFFLLMLVGGIIGGFLGLIITAFEGKVSGLAEIIHTGLLKTAPWITIGIALVSLLIAFLTLQKAKGLSRLWNGEDETAYEKLDKTLGISMGASSVGVILIVTWYGLLVVSVTNDLCKLPAFLAATGVFLVSEVLHTFLQRNCVDVIKALNPEKQGDALSLHFQKEWLESCDEQEKLAAYHASYKSFQALPILSMVIIVILILAAFLFDIGIVPFLIVGIMWLAQTIIYLRESIKNKPAQ